MDKATEQRLLKHAWTYGHFRNPAYPETHEVKQDDYWMLSVDNEIAKQAIESVQLSDVQCDDLCHSYHLRGLDADGDAGPATLALLDIPRCDVPDFAMGEDEFGLTGRGGWSDCDPEREHHHEVVIKFDDRQAPPKWQGYMSEVKAGAVKISADMGLSVRYIDWNSDENFQSSVRFEFIRGGVVGFYYLPQGSGCRTIPRGALDTSFLPDVETAIILWIHEGLGHGVGLQHRAARRDPEGRLRGIMNPSLVRALLSWRGDPSEGDMRRLYTGKPVEPTDPTDPEPPTPDEPYVVATFKAREAGQDFKVITGKKGGGFGDF